MNNKIERLDRIARLNHLIETQTGRRAVRPYRADGYVNLLNRYGTSKDTTEHYFFQPDAEVPDEILTQFYEGNGIFSKVIDAPAEEAVKHGFELEGLADEKIETFYKEALDELDWEETAITSLKWTRLYGGAIAIMLINDGHALEEPLDWEHIESIDDIRVYERALVQPDIASIYSYDPQDPFRTRGSRLGMPEYYRVYSKYGTFTVHESRCLTFHNGKLPESTSSQNYELWGVPEYVRIQRAIRDAEVAHGSATKLLDRSVQAVYKMKDLSAELATEEGETMVLKRLQTLDMARGLMNSIVIDSEGEEYDFRQFSFGGVSEVIDTTCNFLSAVTSIPQTILFGRSPAGMNATGHSDFENYYNYIERMQKRNLKSNLRYLLSVIFAAGVACGEIEEVPKIVINFNPLWSLSETEQVALDQQKASVQATKAQTANTYVAMQVIDPTEVRRKLAEDDEFDIDTILDDYDDEEELFANMPQQQAQPGMEGMPGAEGMMPPMAGGGEPAPAQPPIINQGEGQKTAEEKDAEAGEPGSAPGNAPAATKLPQDKTEADIEQEVEENLPEEEEKRKDAEPTYTGGVGVLVVKDGKILTGIRAGDAYAGTLCGPGGHIENGETPMQAAFRETEEEFGISPNSLVLIGRGYPEPETGYQSYIYLCDDYEGDVNCLDGEMAHPYFYSLNELDLLRPSMFQPFADSIDCINAKFGDDEYIYLVDENAPTDDELNIAQSIDMEYTDDDLLVYSPDYDEQEVAEAIELEDEEPDDLDYDELELAEAIDIEDNTKENLIDIADVRDKITLRNFILQFSLSARTDEDIPDDVVQFAKNKQGKTFAFNPETHATSGNGPSIDNESASSEGRSAGRSTGSFPKVKVFTTLEFFRDKYPDMYDAAKHGNYKAASSLVKLCVYGDSTNPKKLAEKQSKLDDFIEKNKDATIVPVLSSKAEGGNQIPLAFGRLLQKNGMEMSIDVKQKKSVGRTTANKMDRLFNKPEFSGKVEEGKKYLILDDHITDGGTLNSLKNYIESKGGKVVGCTTLSASYGATQLAITKDRAADIRKKFGNGFSELLRRSGIANNIESLTEREGQYIMQANKNELMDRIFAQIVKNKKQK